VASKAVKPFLFTGFYPNVILAIPPVRGLRGSIVKYDTEVPAPFWKE
jgi:hypothetical protein